MVKWGAGYAICVLVGLVFVLAMPLVGCCWCACRCCCDNCGGDRIWTKNYDHNHHNNRTCLMSAVLFSVIFMGYIYSNYFASIKTLICNKNTSISIMQEWIQDFNMKGGPTYKCCKEKW